MCTYTMQQVKQDIRIKLNKINRAGYIHPKINRKLDMFIWDITFQNIQDCRTPIQEKINQQLNNEISNRKN